MNIPSELASFISSSPDDLLKQWSNYENSTIDYCSYYIYCDDINNLLNNNVIDIYDSIKCFINNKIQEYIWHKDQFNLQIIIPSDSNKNDITSPIYFHGLIKYGDNIEDEWYIVYILIELSKKFPNLSIKIVDAEGQFLLIEAADYLPKWIGPENSENRVWIRNGLLHIISPEEVGSNSHSGIKISQAITALQRSNTKLSTCADNRIQRCIKNRTVDVYPGKAIASEFKTICYLPRNVAYLLQAQPELITIAVESFCSSDKNNSKYIAAMSLFERDLKLEEMVTVPIRFTRALYAQMTFKEFHPPKKFHKVMYSINTSSSPDSETLRLVKKAFDIGTRLTVGIEIAYQKSRIEAINKKNNINARYSVQDFIKAMKSSMRIQIHDDPKFVTNLKAKYSHGYIIMSKKNDYDKVSQMNDEEAGVDYFNEDYTDPFVLNPIHSIIGNLLSKRAENPLLFELKHANLSDGDSDDWLYLTPEDFEKEMDERIKNIGATVFKTDADNKTDNKTTTDTKTKSAPEPMSNDEDMKFKIDQLNDVVKGVKQFMNMKSTIDGVYVGDDSDDSDDDNDKDDDGADKDAMFSGIDNINFNDIMQQLLNISNDKNDKNDINDINDINDVKLNEYFSSDDDDSNVDSDDDNNNDNNNDNYKYNNTQESSHGIKNIILSNDNDDDNGNNVKDKDSDDEDSFYNDSDDNYDDSDDGSDNDDTSKNDIDDFMEEYNKYMDAELSSTTLAESFEKVSNPDNSSSDVVDIEKNLIKYLLESHASQLGMPGPATQLLSQLNISLPLPPAMNTKDMN